MNKIRFSNNISRAQSELSEFCGDQTWSNIKLYWNSWFIWESYRVYIFQSCLYIIYIYVKLAQRVGQFYWRRTSCWDENTTSPSSLSVKWVETLTSPGTSTAPQNDWSLDCFSLCVPDIDTINCSCNCFTNSYHFHWCTKLFLLFIYFYFFL